MFWFEKRVQLFVPEPKKISDVSNFTADIIIKKLTLIKVIEMKKKKKLLLFLSFLNNKATR